MKIIKILLTFGNIQKQITANYTEKIMKVKKNFKQMIVKYKGKFQTKIFIQKSYKIILYKNLK